MLNTNLEFYYRKGRLSFKSYTVLRNLNLTNLLQFKNFVDKNNNFLKIKECGNEENCQLLDFYSEKFLTTKSKKKPKPQKEKLKNKTSPKNVDINDDENCDKDITQEVNKECITGPISIDYLYTANAVSFKTFEFCKKKNIVTLFDLNVYVENEKNYFGIKGLNKDESDEILQLHKLFFIDFYFTNKIEIKTMDSLTIKERKKIILAGISETTNFKKIKARENYIYFDGYTFSINVVEIEMAPIYWVKRDGLILNIFFNKANHKSNLFEENSFIKILIALTRTSLSFSDESGDIFLNRLKNYLDLI
jgi:hypothetical protein